MPNHNSNDKEELTITEKSKVNLSVLISAIIIAGSVVGTYLSLKWDVSGLRKDLNAGFGKSLTVEQFNHWREDAVEMNAGKGVTFPRLPPKDAAYGWLIPKDLLASKSTFRLNDLN